MFGLGLVLIKDKVAKPGRNLPIDKLSPNQKLIFGLAAILLGVIIAILETINI
jgi:hypothetical protein